MTYYLSILVSLNASLLHELNIVSFSRSQATDQNILEYLQNLEYFSCNMRVRIHGFFTQQLNFARQETSVFSLIFSFPPSFNPHKMVLKTPSGFKILVFICFRFPSNSEKTDVLKTPGMMSPPPFIESLKTVVRSSLEVALSPPTARWPPASAPQEQPG